MSAEALWWAMQTRRVDDPIDRLLLLYLGDGADQDHRTTASLGDPLLAQWTGEDQPALAKRMDRLAERGLLTVEEFGQGGIVAQGFGVVVTLAVEAES